MLRHIVGRFARRRPAKVSVLIPAWQSEAFIDRTLSCARRQTYEDMRILVSIDVSEDRTEEICRGHAKADPRISVFVQSERLGWARNVNFLLDRADTEFFFLYFHDDIIEPSYTARLLDALVQRPDAASAHCDMGHFGTDQGVSVGRQYEGNAAGRVCSFLVGPRGSPLRSMTRRAAVGRLRLPADGAAGFWANQPYLVGLVAAGPALHLPEVLYMRWDRRKGGLTDGWRTLSSEQMRAGFRTNASALLTIADALPASDAERDAVRFCAFLYLMQSVRNVERDTGMTLFESAVELHEAFADFARPPVGLDAMSPEIKQWAIAAHANLRPPAASQTR